jgi:hypothetical protein
MSKYRAYIICSDVEFQNLVSLECADDAVALKKAKQLVDAVMSSFGSSPVRQLRSITSRSAYPRHD